MKKEKEDSSLPATIQGTSFLVVSQPSKTVKAIEGLAEMGATERNLYAVKIPAAGGSFWTLPDENGEETPAKTFEGVIAVAQYKLRAWWKDPMGSGDANMPPSCISTDSLRGYGINDPKAGLDAYPDWHDCQTCVWDKFGSSRRKEGGAPGKDCKETRRLIIFRKGDFLPLVLTVSVGSFEALTSYAVRLQQVGKTLQSVVTQFGLEQTKNRDGIVYSRITFKSVGGLSAEEIAAFENIGAEIQNRLLVRRRMEQTEAQG